MHNLFKRSLTAGLVLAMFLAAPVWAQETGSISGVVTDPDGAPLPGVAVTMNSVQVPQSTIYTQANGAYRFPALPPGSNAYSITFALEGFQTIIQEELDVRLGTNAQVNVTMGLSTVEETVTVTGTTPIVDVKNTGTGQNISEEYMQSIPSARDPWVMMQQTAGMQVSKENVGGSGSGQQSGFSSGGSRSGDNVWTYDGAEMTDMSALGASPMYYDFDAFEEVAISTGGNDPSVATGGIKINFVTKRGGNQWRGSGRFYVTPGDLQSRNVGDPDTGELIGNYTEDDLVPGYIGNSINNIKDFGGELGGPIVRDRLFVWGAYGKQDIKQNVGVTPDDTQLTNIHGKANLHLGDKMVLNYTYLDAGKTKQGRGASATRPGPTTWNQGGVCCIHTGKVQYTINDNNYVEGSYNSTALGFFLEPQGGREVQVTRNLDTGLWGGSYFFYDTQRPLKNARVDANTYMAGSSVDHELKYGFSWRDAETASISGLSSGSAAYFTGSGDPGDPTYARLTHNTLDNYKNVRTSFYVGDTISADRLTINAGLRYDRQASESLPSAVPANKFAPELMPAQTFGGRKNDFAWTGISPRIGLTYMLSDKTLVRANAARYYAQQFNGEFHLTNITFGPTMLFDWNDANGNKAFDPGETVGDAWSISAGFDPENPNAPIDIVINETRPPTTDELIFGIEHELTRELAIGADFTYRKNARENWRIRTNEDQAATWESVQQTRTLGDGSSQTITVFQPVNARETEQTYSERDGFNTKYTGITAYLEKRFSNNWMGNASFSYANPTINYDQRSAFTDETNIASAQGNPGSTTQSATWFLKLSGMYQLPAGFSLAGFFQAREGYVHNPVIRSATRANGVGSINFRTTNFGEERLGTFWNMDFRVEKTFDLSDRGRIHLIADIFNLTGNDIVLGRRESQTSSSANLIDDVVQGRTIRLGARLVLR